MNDKILEGFLKSALSLYRESYQARNPGIEIDFATDFFSTKINPAEAAKKQGIDPKGVPDKEIQVTYFKITKLVKDGEPRVIFASYQPDKGKKRPWVRLQLLREALKHFIIGGIEYSEALFLYNKEQEEKKNTLNPEEELIDEPETESEPKNA